MLEPGQRDILARKASTVASDPAPLGPWHRPPGASPPWSTPVQCLLQPLGFPVLVLIQPVCLPGFTLDTHPQDQEGLVLDSFTQGETVGGPPTPGLNKHFFRASWSWGGDTGLCPFTVEKDKAQSHCVIYPGSPSRSVSELGFELRLCGPSLHISDSITLYPGFSAPQLEFISRYFILFGAVVNGTVFFISLSNSLLLVWKMQQILSCNLAEFVSSNTYYLVGFYGFIKYCIICK